MKILKLIPVVVFSFAAQIALAGSVTTSCEGGNLNIKLGVSDGESCSVTQTVVINGVSDTSVYSIASDAKKVVKLKAGDNATATVQMSCTSPAGNSSASASASTSDGCQGSQQGFDEPFYYDPRKFFE